MCQGGALMSYGLPVKMRMMTGWWFQPTPLKNDEVRQLG